MGRSHVSHGRPKDLFDCIKEMTHPSPMEGGDEILLGKIDEFELEIEATPGFITLILRHPIPLIESHNQPATDFKHHPKKICVLIGDAFPSIQEVNHNMRLFNSLHGLDDTKLLDRFSNLAAAPNPRRVNQGVTLTMAFKRNFNTVPSGPWRVKDDHPLLTKETIDQGGLPHIGTPNDRNPDATLFFLRELFNAWKAALEEIQKGFNALCMRGGNRLRLTQCEGMEIGGR